MVCVNEAFEQLSGCRASDVLTRNCRVVQGPDTDLTARTAISQAPRDRRPLRVRPLNQRPCGQHRWKELRPSHVRDPTGTTTHVPGLQHDVTELVQYLQRLQDLACRDERTGPPNRHQFSEHLALALVRARRTRTAVCPPYLDVAEGQRVVERTSAVSREKPAPACEAQSPGGRRGAAEVGA